MQLNLYFVDVYPLHVPTLLRCNINTFKRLNYKVSVTVNKATAIEFFNSIAENTGFGSEYAKEWRNKTEGESVGFWEGTEFFLEDNSDLETMQFKLNVETGT